MHGAVMTDAQFLQQEKEKENKKNKTQQKPEEEDKDSDADNSDPIESELSDINDENQEQLQRTVIHHCDEKS